MNIPYENDIENSNNKEQIDEPKSDKFTTNAEEKFSENEPEIDYDYEEKLNESGVKIA